MSDSDIRRAAPLVPLKGGESPAQEAPNAQQLAHRFMRAMIMTSRRADVSRSDRGSSHRSRQAASSGAHSADDIGPCPAATPAVATTTPVSARGDAGTMPGRPAATPLPEDRPRPHSVPTIAEPPASERHASSMDEGAEACNPDAAGGGEQRDAPPRDWQDALADLVSVLSGRAEGAFETWSVNVPLPSDILPESSLRLSVSPHDLTLRFHTNSSVSMNLISSHQDRLAALLRRAVPGTRDIVIDVT